jgi:hypothetical protein
MPVNKQAITYRIMAAAKCLGYGPIQQTELPIRITDAPNAQLFEGPIRIEMGNAIQLYMIAFDRYDAKAPIYANWIINVEQKFNAIDAKKCFIKDALTHLLDKRTNFN